MLIGETQALFPKSYSPSCFPVPPPPPRSGTLYACWKDLGCMFDNLPLWKYDSSRSISWAANSYDWCMTPAYLYDRFVYRICCCGDSRCFDGGVDCCEYFVCCLILPKIPCVVLGGAAALFSGIAGSVGDCVAPQRELMDEPPSLFSVAKEEKGAENEIPLLQDAADAESNSDVHKTRVKKHILNVSDLTTQIDTWIKQKDLSAAIKFFIGKDNKLDRAKISLFSHSELYPKKIFLICLAIRHPVEEINLETRKNFILALLDHEVINGYNSTEGWIAAPLLEAMRSNYRYASDLLDLLCQYGANLFKPCGSGELPYLLILSYASLLENQNYELFYRAALLLSYAKKIPKKIKSFLEKDGNAAYKDIHASVSEAAISLTNRNQILTQVNSYTRVQNLSLAKLICQYSGLFSSDTFDPIIREPIPLLTSAGSIAESKAEEKEFQKGEGLNRYNPLPEYRRLEAVQSSSVSQVPGYIRVGI